MILITAYPVAGKAKSQQICEAFIQGLPKNMVGGIANGVDKLRTGAAFFYGVDKSNAHLYAESRANPQQHPYYYCDNSYFDSARQEYFRISKNSLQHSGEGTSDGKRFAELGVEIKPWQQNKTGHLVICPQSDHFMQTIVGYQGDWLKKVLAELSIFTLPIRVREWNRDKGKLSASLGEDLLGAYGLITWSSAAAITAILSGIPAVTESSDCGARPMSGNIKEIGSLPMLSGRENWAGVLADNQWTLDEFRSGIAWRKLQGD